MTLATIWSQSIPTMRANDAIRARAVRNRLLAAAERQEAEARVQGNATEEVLSLQTQLALLEA